MSPITLDPIVSLSVAIAETPGSHAFFLGSGVSRDAGVPTGGQVLRGALADLARLETPDGQTPPEDLDAWLEQTGRQDVSYSDILEALVPQPDDRRAYLASRLEGREPGETHKRLAALARDGWVRVFVTTNFDRLLEQALRDVGVEPVVVSDEEGLARSPAREHADCFVLKVHGDMLQRTIRNTEAELAALDPAIAVQLQEILDRYGIVVLGYSGSDPAIRDALERRDSRYGLYWQARSPLNDPIRTLVQGRGGRVITRDTAAELLRDLQRRVALYRAHPTGETPELIDAETVRLLRAGDDVGLRELALTEQHAFESRVRDVVAAHRSDREQAVAVHQDLTPALERYLGSHLALIRHGSPLFTERARALGNIAATRLPGHDGVYRHIGQWLAWWLSYACGGYAVAVENFTAVGDIFSTNVDAQYFRRRSLGVMFPGDAGDEIAPPLLKKEVGGQYHDPPFVLVAHQLRASQWLRDRYPEFVIARSEPQEGLAPPDVHLADFSFLRTLKAGQLGGDRHHASWTVYGTGAEAFAERLVDDVAVRERVAVDAFKVSLDTFTADAPGWLEAATYPGTMPRGHSDSEAAYKFRAISGED